MNSEIKTGLIFGAIIAASLGILGIALTTLDQEAQTTPFTEIDPLAKTDKSEFRKMPKLAGIANYLNTTPEELKKEMEGKVILYDIWTYSCINCIRTLPYITAWNDKYSDQGLLIIGVHSPEFEFEKDPENVQIAIEKYGIEYPVVLDNDMETWKAFENRYWPRKYIADHEGYIRYDHIGEGGYKETERVIQKLLEERNASLGVQTSTASSLVEIKEFEHSLFRTPELYFGHYFAQNRNQLGSEEGFQPGKTVTYSEPDKINLHNFYPIGKWTNNKENMQLASDTGAIKLQYNAKEVNIVTENNAVLKIFLDGEPLPEKYAGSDITSGNELVTSEAKLYNIISSTDSASHRLEMEIQGSGFQIFSFTFG